MRTVRYTEVMIRILFMCMALCFLSLSSRAVAQEPVQPVLPDQNVEEPDVSVLPPPVEAQVLGGIVHTRWHKPVRTASFVAMLGGIGISVAGLVSIFSGVGEGFDQRGIHSGALVVVGGSLVSSLSSILFEGLSASPE